MAFMVLSDGSRVWPSGGGSFSEKEGGEIMVLYLEALDQILRREVVLTECVRQVFQAWGFESPFDEETIGNLSLARMQVQKMLEDGITEVRIPEKE